MALMAKAKKQAQGEQFAAPDIAQFVPQGMEDAVERIIAAGAKMMYSPQMRDEVMKQVQGDQPIATKLAHNVAGLLMVLDQKAQGGMPVQAIFPAAIGLMGEAASVLQAAGQTVTQEDFNEAARMVFVLLAKKMGASDEQIMEQAGQFAGGDDGDDNGAMEGEPMQAGVAA